jgi:hypothetical protein
MDPSQIAAIPFPLERLTPYVMLPVVVQMIYWLVTNPAKLTMKILSLIKVTAIAYGLMALSGNYIVTNAQHSMLAALYLATLISTTSNGTSTYHVLDEFPFKDMSDQLTFCQLYCTIMFTTGFQVLTVLDHGMQIQRWPVPVLVGATYGYVFGSVAGILLGYARSLRGPPKTKE